MKSPHPSTTGFTSAPKAPDPSFTELPNKPDSCIPRTTSISRFSCPYSCIFLQRNPHLPWHLSWLDDFLYFLCLYYHTFLFYPWLALHAILVLLKLETSSCFLALCCSFVGMYLLDPCPILHVLYTNNDGSPVSTLVENKWTLITYTFLRFLCGIFRLLHLADILGVEVPMGVHISQ